jgi:hypothetical protein
MLKMTDIIHIGDGRYINYTEGAALRPPVIKKKWVRPKFDPSRHATPLITHSHKRPNKDWSKLYDGLVGYRELVEFRQGRYMKFIARGRPFGHTRGLNKHELKIAHDAAREQAKKDMEQIKKNIDMTEAAEEALEGAITVLRQPASQQVKLAAAKLVLEFTKSKPVAKSEVSVNKAEEWLASLAADD